MRKMLSRAVVILVVASTATSCALLPEASAEQLRAVVQRDGIPFDAGEIPPEILDRLASHRVVLVGETHFLKEHRNLMAELMRELHARGFRQFLYEWTQAADWLLADFVEDGGLEPEWTPSLDVGGSMVIAIRDFNRTLPESERVRVHAIDVTVDYGGAQSFRGSLGGLARHLPDPGPITALLDGEYDTPESQEAAIDTLRAELDASRQELTAAWGPRLYDAVVEMVEVERHTVPIRAIRESNYDKSVRMREAAIKKIVDRRLRDFPHGTLINIGATHAQKKRLWGTEIEWLGDYLVDKSPEADGSVIVLDVSAAYIVSIPGSGYPDSDLSGSPENGLLRVMSETWPERIVFLPADDPVFSRRRVPILSDGIVYKGVLRRHYDAFVLLPRAHRERFDS